MSLDFLKEMHCQKMAFQQLSGFACCRFLVGSCSTLKIFNTINKKILPKVCYPPIEHAIKQTEGCNSRRMGSRISSVFSLSEALTTFCSPFSAINALSNPENPPLQKVVRLPND